MANFQPTQISEHIEKIFTWNPRTSNNNTPFAYVDLSSVDQEKKEICKTSLMLPNEAPSRARQLISKNDVLVATVRPNLNAVALVSAELDGATASTGFCVLRPNQKTLDSRYLYHWVQNKIFIENMVSKATGASYPAVSDKIIKESTIPTPKIEEQKRIATILDKAHSIRQKRQQNLEIADALIKSIFLDMFGDPVTNPKGWDKVNLDSLYRVTSSKRIYKTELQTSGIPFLRISDLVNKIENLEDKISLFISHEKYIEISNKYGVPKGNDILITSRGTLGKCYLVKDKDRFYFQDGMISWLTEKMEIVHNLYIIQLFKTESLSANIYSTSKGATVDFLSLQKLANLNIPLPPINLQNKFAEIVTKIEAQKAKQQEHLHEAEQIFKALQQQFFG